MTSKEGAPVLVLVAALFLMIDSTVMLGAEGLPLTSGFKALERAVPRQVGRVGAASAGDGRTLILDSRDHRVLELRQEEWTVLGAIGNGPGDLFYPTEMTIENRSYRIAIYEGGNRRVQIFDRALRPLGQIKIAEKVFGLAWWRDGRLLLGSPELGALLAVYDESSSSIGTLGELPDPPQLAELQQASREVYQRAVSRIRLSSTPEGDIWVAFIHLPLLRRYSPSGTLEIERTLDLEGLGVLSAYAESIWDLSNRPENATFINIDGLQLALVVKDITVNPRTGWPIVLLGNDWLAALDFHGRINLVGPIVGCGSSFNRLGIDTERESLLLISFGVPGLCEVDLDELEPSAYQAAPYDRAADSSTPEAGPTGGGSGDN